MEALSRIVIFGNSGSGKSTLARNLAALADAPIVDLDIFH
jgi:adenylate kinase family enzyme